MKPNDKVVCINPFPKAAGLLASAIPEVGKIYCVREVDYTPYFDGIRLVGIQCSLMNNKEMSWVSQNFRLVHRVEQVES